MKVCDKTCIFFFFPIINKYFLMAERSLLSRCPSYVCGVEKYSIYYIIVVIVLNESRLDVPPKRRTAVEYYAPGEFNGLDTSA